jgi:hypothetical protein
MTDEKKSAGANQADFKSKYSNSNDTPKQSHAKAIIVLFARRGFLPYAAANYLIRVFRLAGA